MKREGLRPRFRFGWPPAQGAGALRRVYPFRRSWIAIGVLAAFDAVFLFPAVTTFRQAVAEWSRFDSLFDLVGALFLSAWLMGWSIGPLLMTTLLLLMLFGRETLTVRPGSFAVTIGLPGLGLTATYDPGLMRNLRWNRPEPKSGTSWRGPHLVFDYGASRVEFGSDVDYATAEALRGSIEAASGTRIRTGPASPEAAFEARAGMAAAPEQPAPPPVQREPLRFGAASTVALILANLVPLAGTVFLDWQLSDVMVLYWAESAVIGFYNLLKIIAIGRWSALLAGPFFVGHFGAFMAVHFLFVYGIFIEGMQPSGGGDLREVAALFVSLWPALLALFLSHGYSFVVNFMGRQEYRGRRVQDQMSEPYSRIVFMHLVLIFGGFLTMLLGGPTPVLVAVIVLKVAIDLRSHLKERERATASGGSGNQGAQTGAPG